MHLTPPAIRVRVEVKVGVRNKGGLFVGALVEHFRGSLLPLPASFSFLARQGFCGLK